jgi:hypothetical protein
MGDLINGVGIRVAGVMTDAKREGAQCHWSIRMRYDDEYSTETAIRPRHIGLHAAAEVRSVPTFGLASLKPRLRDATFTAQLLTKFPQRILGAQGQPFKILSQGVIVKADRKDRLRPGFGHG